MANIGDVWLRLVLDDGEFLVQAKKAGQKGGEEAGTLMASGLKSKLSGLFKTSIFAGAGIEIGRQALFRLEDAISGVINAIPDLIQRGQDFALTVDDISDKTGASAESSSRLAGTFEYLGIATSGLGMSLKTLSTEIVANEDKFKKLGIATRDSSGNLLDTITILGNVRSYLSGAGDGATKLALANDLLGKSAGDLIDYLNLTDEQAAALNDTLDDLGVTIGEKARRDAEALTREQNLVGLAFQGLANILFTEVGPAIRTVLGGATQFIRDHSKQIVAAITDMTNALFGFISGLLGFSDVRPFQTQLDALGGSTGDVTLSFDQWAQQMGYTIPKINETTGATKANTTAIDAQIDSVEKQIDAERRATDARTDAIDAQIEQLDLSERQIAIDQRRRDLNEQLNEAQLALIEAQGGTDAGAISEAMARVGDIREQQAENERKLGVDAQRQALEDQREQIVASGDAKQDELALLKASLADQRSALQAAGSVRKSDNAQLLAELKTQYDAYVADQTTSTRTYTGMFADMVRGDPKTGTGLGGALTKAFTDGQTAGEAFRLFLTDKLVPAIEGLIGTIGALIDKLNLAALGLQYVTDPALRQKVEDAGGFAGSGPLDFLFDLLGGLAAAESNPNRLAPLLPVTGNEPARVAGGSVMAGRPFIGNERRQEFFVPDQNGTIIPSLDAMRSWMGGSQTIEVPVYLDGDVLTRVVSRRQADQYNH